DNRTRRNLVGCPGCLNCARHGITSESARFPNDEWCVQTPLHLPHCTAVSYQLPLVHRRVHHLTQVEEMDVLRVLDGSCGSEDFSQPFGATAQDRPSQGEVKGLFFPKGGVVLGH